MKFKSQENEKYFFKKFSIMNITAVSLNIYSECLYAEKEGSLYNILIIQYPMQINHYSNSAWLYHFSFKPLATKS